MSLGELGRFPEHIKSVIAAVKYWVRMENDSGNALLQNAFEVCKSENHFWIQDLRYLLNSNGLQYIVNNVKNLHPNYIVSKIKQRLMDPGICGHLGIRFYSYEAKYSVCFGLFTFFYNLVCTGF